MAKKLKKNGFVDGTLISYISILFTKILGMLYIIPFTALIGEDGMVIYSCAYLIYNLVLNASTSGIPTATSILISEYNTREMHKTKMKIYRVGNAVSMSMGIAFFILLEIFANNIADFYINEIASSSAPVSVSQVAAAIRCIGVCLLVVPFLSIYRGFLQGHKVLTVSAFSQVIEQITRIAAVLIGAYVAVKVFNLSSSVGVNIALLGAGIGALAAILYLKLKTRNSDDVIIKVSNESEVLSSKQIVKRFLFYCIPILIVAVSANIYEIVDNVLVVYTMSNLGIKDSVLVGSVISTYAPKIAMIISALAMGLTNTIVPEMAALVAKEDFKQANVKLCSAINIIFGISLPITMGIVILAGPVYSLFYGSNAAQYGSLILRFVVPVNVISCIKITLCMAMQGLKKTKAVCIATIVGIIANIIFDVPLMYLLYYMGATGTCYIGAVISTFIGQSMCIVIILGVLRKSFNFRYGSILKSFFKVLYPTVIMGVVVFALNYFLPVTNIRSFLQVIHLGAYAVIGAAIYFALIFKNRAVYEVFGEKAVENILVKLRLKKKSY
ncbi:MAG: oligosaccharide flippase family protein [Acutalibacteraceae bacterium]